MAVLDEEGRAAKLAEVLAFYDDFGRGMDGMQLPYVTRCFRVAVADRDEPVGDSDASDDFHDQAGGPGRSDGTDTDMLLIDFR